MKLEVISFPDENEPYNKEILRNVNSGIETTMGTVFLREGTRIPKHGFSRHPFNEISMVIEGCIEMLNEDGSAFGLLEEGTVVSINALEPQAGNVLRDTKLIYVINKLSN